MFVELVSSRDNCRSSFSGFTWTLPGGAFIWAVECCWVRQFDTFSENRLKASARGRRCKVSAVLTSTPALRRPAVLQLQGNAVVVWPVHCSSVTSPGSPTPASSYCHRTVWNELLYILQSEVNEGRCDNYVVSVCVCSVISTVTARSFAVTCAHRSVCPWALACQSLPEKLLEDSESYLCHRAVSCMKCGSQPIAASIGRGLVYEFMPLCTELHI